MRKFFLIVLLSSFSQSSLWADTVLITGTNSGMGLEYASQYLNSGWQVIATHRRESVPGSLAELKSRYEDRLRIEKVDITDIGSVKDLGKRLAGVPIDVLINNAGFGGDFTGAEQTFGTLDYEMFEPVMFTNGMGAIAVSEALIENVMASDQKKIVAMASPGGSMSIKHPMPGGYWYKMSKAALHMSMLTLAGDLKDTDVIVTMVYPGVIFSEKNLERGIPREMMVDRPTSISMLIDVIDSLKPADSGKFIGYDSKELSL